MRSCGIEQTILANVGAVYSRAYENTLNLIVAAARSRRLSGNLWSHGKIEQVQLLAAPTFLQTSALCRDGSDRDRLPTTIQPLSMAFQLMQQVMELGGQRFGCVQVIVGQRCVQRFRLLPDGADGFL